MADCKECGAHIGVFASAVNGVCMNCVREREAKSKVKLDALGEDVEAAIARIVLTTETAHNLPVAERLGIVAAECVIGMNLFRDFAASVRDVVGGRSATMQRGLREARETALYELRREAVALGADAVVGIDLDYSEISGAGKNMLFLVASGTAVRLASS